MVLLRTYPLAENRTFNRSRISTNISFFCGPDESDFLPLALTDEITGLCTALADAVLGLTIFDVLLMGSTMIGSL